MRVLRMQLQVTADGYLGGPDGELDWMTVPWSDDLTAYGGAVHDGVDTIVLGRRLAEGFIPAWAAGPEGEDQESIDFMNSTPKVVVSDSLTESPWDGVTVRGGDLGALVTELKERDGGTIITYGGASLAQQLVAQQLVDELHLFVNPVAIGAGLPVFPAGQRHRLRLVRATPTECGITVLHYAPDR
jgi:dihydrofolate reductase